MKLTPEDLEKVRTKNIANILRKQADGKTLTGREEAALSAAVAGLEPPVSSYCSTWDDLAQALGTTRRSLQEWRTDPRYSHDCPADRADGRHDVAAFTAWMVRHNLKRAQLHIPSDAAAEDAEAEAALGIVRPPKIAGSQADWGKAILHEKHETQRLKRLTLEGTLLVAADLEVPLGATLATIQTKLSQFPARVARYLVGLREASEIEDKLRDEIDADLSDLHAARFVETTLATILADLHFDAESARLVQLVTFAGQDEAALRELIARVALEVLRRLGANTLNSEVQNNEDAPAVGEPAVPPAAAADTPLPAQPAIPTLETPGAIARKTQSGKGNSGKALASKARKRKSRRQPATPPAAVEAAIVKTRRKKPRPRH